MDLRGLTPPPRTIGRFRIVRFLGRGGMGEVYLADDPELDRAVALKVLASEGAHDPDREAFFRREATSAAALNHPNICTIFEVGEADGVRYIAMEAIEGETLSDKLKHGPLSIDATIDIALQIASALEEAQARRVVHRDLKSANIMITPKGGVKVLDFGLAKRVEQAPAAPHDPTRWASRRDIVFGTLPYMSPEQALGRAVDHRSDLFSLGTILYEALSGQMPFDGPTTAEVLNAVVNREPPPLGTLNPRVPPGLTAIVARLLAKDPSARYQSASDLIADLRAFQRTGDLPQRRAAVRRRTALVVAAAAAAVVFAAIGVAWWRTHRVTVTTGNVQSLVVVPASVTGPPQFQFLADAVPNSLTTRLAGSSALKVKIPPTSIEFANVGGSLTRVADSYGVPVCVVPRVVVSGGRLTVNVQVVEPKRRDIVWSAEFEGPLDRYADAVVRAADALTIGLTGRRGTTVAAAAAPSSALELALSRGQFHGRLFNNKYEKNDFDIAQGAYQEALRLDPRSAQAAAGLAYLQIFAMQGSGSAERELPILDDWARRAIEFDPRYALGWAARAVAENWRPQPDAAKQLDYGFRAASLGEACGGCQLALMEGLMQFSQVLTHHVAQQDAELDPLSAYGYMNSAVALAALGRSDEASAAIARAAAIEPEARWVGVLRAFTQAASGSVDSAAAEADVLAASGKLKTLPNWVSSIADLIRAQARHDSRALTHVIAQLGEAVRQRRASTVEVQYVTSAVVPLLARTGHPDEALALLADATAAGAPPPYDMLLMNPFVKRLTQASGARNVVEGSLERFGVLLKAIDGARSAGRFPRYLEQPLQDVLVAVRDSGRGL